MFVFIIASIFLSNSFLNFCSGAIGIGGLGRYCILRGTSTILPVPSVCKFMASSGEDRTCSCSCELKEEAIELAGTPGIEGKEVGSEREARSPRTEPANGVRST